MYNEEINKVTLAARDKIELLNNNKIGYFISSILAGIYIGLGVMLAFTIGGLLTPDNIPLARIVMGLSFGVALSLVLFAGAELFTGSNFIMSVGALTKEVSWVEVIKVWIVSFVGNLLGSILAGLMFVQTGLASGTTGEFIAKASALKMSLPVNELLFRGIFCNMLVCLAIWCSFKCKEEVSKLIMIFWCLFAFITTGFEHSIANMTLLTIGLASPLGQVVSIGGYAYNIFVVTLGNMIGGVIFLAIPYYIISRKQKVN
ncbi:formate/nitrite transporter family protein [Clostridium isatidis]|uniref:formate/nitrite transporter family protein n=1 Tax=Clostridium isatidis TaxID=182773 RepID=UPI003AAB0913